MKVKLQLKSKSRRKDYRKEIQSKWPRPAPSLVFLSSHQRGAKCCHLDVGGSPRDPRAALLRLRSVYSPTHYYVRVSRVDTFTGTSLASYSQTRAPSCAALDHRWGVRKPGRCQGTKGTLAAPSVTTGPLAGGRLASASPAEDHPLGDALLHAAWGGALLPAPPTQPPVRFPWWKGGCHAGAPVHRCDLIHLQLVVSISLFLRV